MRNTIIAFALAVGGVAFGFWLRGFCKPKPKAFTLLITKQRREPIPKETQ